MELGDATSSTEQGSLPVRLLGSTTVVALQFDVSYPAAKVAISAPVARAALAQAHQVTFRELAAGKTRVVVYSSRNKALPTDLLLDLPLTVQTGSNTMDAVVTLSNIWFADASGRMIPASASYGPVTKWKRFTFTLAELNDPVISGDSADSDGDGLPNLVELLLRGRAKFSDLNRLPVPEQFTDPNDGKQYLTLTYRQSKSVQGVAGEVQASTDLFTWPLTVPATATGVEDAETIEMRAALDVTGQPKVFLRLRAKRVPTP